MTTIMSKYSAYCRAGIAVGIVALTLASGAHASPILTLFNTGVFADGTLMNNGATGDVHYTLVSMPLLATSTLQARTSAGGFPIGPWLGDDTLSRWIGPNSNNSIDGPPGLYDYQTTFDLTGFSPASALLLVKWAGDNSGVDVLINGAATVHSIPNPGYTAFSPFTISTGFRPGLNTLDFLVRNSADTVAPNNSTGLRVEISGTATATIPEPVSFVLIGTGLAGLGMLRRRRLGWARKL